MGRETRVSHLKVAHPSLWGFGKGVSLGEILRRDRAVFCMGIVESVIWNVSSTLSFVTDAISRREIFRGRDFGVVWEGRDLGIMGGR